MRPSNLPPLRERGASERMDPDPRPHWHEKRAGPACGRFRPFFSPGCGGLLLRHEVDHSDQQQSSQGDFDHSRLAFLSSLKTAPAKRRNARCPLSFFVLGSGHPSRSCFGSLDSRDPERWTRTFRFRFPTPRISREGGPPPPARAMPRSPPHRARRPSSHRCGSGSGGAGTRRSRTTGSSPPSQTDA